MNMAIILQKPFNQAKTRLKGWLSPSERIGLVQAMLYDVVETLTVTPLLDRIGILTSDPRAINIAKELGIEVFYEEKVVGMNHALVNFTNLLDEEVKSLFVLPADIPLISSADISEVVNISQRVPITIIPCRKGSGTNGLVLSPPNALKTAFGRNSKTKHCYLARALDLQHIVYRNSAFSYDIDLVEDLLCFERLGDKTKTKEFLEHNKILNRLIRRQVVTS
ncbi:2-phospho-L-lactate guanylyltransferase [Alkalihalobacterium alkalinitrilicum]|uniref:2-phospho-L-lactate guanylyltransferase n=1 Tax=Alkalihalobacterium alkalinitrilicum TaxID=427920 RepID=UPI00099513E0|nr:2-phospho-L-lactate guanylyltransferase [Alkalihalobacterium alkalinitrilicum]